MRKRDKQIEKEAKKRGEKKERIIRERMDRLVGRSNILLVPFVGYFQDLLVGWLLSEFLDLRIDPIVG